MTAGRPLSIAYLTSRYPMLSMSFVLREVIEMRRLGARIDVASINAPDRSPTQLSDEEQAEAMSAYCLKQDGIFGAAIALVDAALRRPSGFLGGLALAVRLAGTDLRRIALNLAYFAEAAMVGRWMRRKGQTHLHVHLGSQPATVGLLARRVFGTGLSMTVHGPDEFFDVERQYLAAKVAACSFVCCISHYARSQLMRVAPVEHWDRLLVCRLGVDPGTFKPDAAHRRSHDGALRVVCLGRLTPAKGQHRLLDAIAKASRAGHSIQLTIVGDGVDRDSLQRHAKRLGLSDEVLFPGAVNHDAVRAHYLAADCFCLPSFAEGIPIVLMEAMAVELPCVTTWVAGIPELIRDGIDGFLVAPSDDDSLAEVLATLAGDPGLRRRVGHAARQRVTRDYDLARNVAALHAVFTARLA